ncbi:MAG: hypothetical protein J6Z31_00680 [Fibrobacter sp.]|nr:hypothetical protein [Fibrobacter sp.]
MKFQILKWLGVLLCMLFLNACEEEQTLLSLDLYGFHYRESAPVSVQVYDSNSVMQHVPPAWHLQRYAISNMAEVNFAPTPGDTLHIRILEFSSDMAALAFYLNSGLVQETLPVVEGESREIAMRSGKRLFVFRYGILRNHERAELERYVQSFPDYRAGLPQEFLSLPFQDRITWATSIQMRDFLGIPSDFPMLIQGYQGDGLRWNAARSWGYVSQDEWQIWIANARRHDREVGFSADTVLFNAGAGERGAALRLQGGRVVCVWGALDAESLRERFQKVAQNVYDSPE